MKHILAIGKRINTANMVWYTGYKYASPCPDKRLRKKKQKKEPAQ